MLGDGINDSACIAQADLGISMGMGSDLSLDRSDVVLIQNRLDSLPKSILISKKRDPSFYKILFYHLFIIR